MACNNDWGMLASNTKKLNDQLRIAAKGRPAFVTELSTLAAGSGLDDEDVRVSAAVLLFGGNISEIIPVSGGKIRVCLREA